MTTTVTYTFENGYFITKVNGKLQSLPHYNEEQKKVNYYPALSKPGYDAWYVEDIKYSEDINGKITDYSQSKLNCRYIEDSTAYDRYTCKVNNKYESLPYYSADSRKVYYSPSFVSEKEKTWHRNGLYHRDDAPAVI